MVEFIIAVVAVVGLVFSLVALIALSVELVQYGGLFYKGSEARIAKGGADLYTPFVFMGVMLVVCAAVLAG